MVKRIVEVSEYEEIAKLDREWSSDEIIHSILEETGWEISSIYNKSKRAESVFRRGIVDLICTCNGISIKELSIKTIRDHTTVIHSLQNIEMRLDNEMASRNFLRDLVKDIKENNKKDL